MRRRSLALLWLAVGAAAFGVSVLPAAWGGPFGAPGDAWVSVEGARWVAHGAVGTVYSAVPTWFALPTWLAILAPFVLLADHLGLASADAQFHLPHAPAWWVVGPAFGLASAAGVIAAAVLADMAGMPARRQAMAAGVAGLTIALSCILLGHPEDALAMAALAVALRHASRDRWDHAAYWMALAVCLQTWAGLFLPWLLAASPPGRRLKTALWSCLPPLAIAGALLAADPRAAWRSLVEQPRFLPDTLHGPFTTWHYLAPVVHLRYGHEVVSAILGSPSRTAATVAAVVVGWAWRRRRDPETLIALVALIGWLRIAGEIELWGFYAVPVFAALAVTAARKEAPWPLKVVLLATTAVLLGALDSGQTVFGGPTMGVWWTMAVLAASGLVVVRLAALSAPRRRQPRAGGLDALLAAACLGEGRPPAAGEAEALNVPVLILAKPRCD